MIEPNESFPLPQSGLYADFESGEGWVRLNDEFLALPGTIQLAVLTDWKDDLERQYRATLAQCERWSPDVVLRVRLPDAIDVELSWSNSQAETTLDGNLVPAYAEWPVRLGPSDGRQFAFRSLRNGSPASGLQRSPVSLPSAQMPAPSIHTDTPVAATAIGTTSGPPKAGISKAASSAAEIVASTTSHPGMPPFNQAPRASVPSASAMNNATPRNSPMPPPMALRASKTSSIRSAPPPLRRRGHRRLQHGRLDVHGAGSGGAMPVGGRTGE